jgi:hypothetical protein
MLIATALMLIRGPRQKWNFTASAISAGSQRLCRPASLSMTT